MPLVSSRILKGNRKHDSALPSSLQVLFFHRINHILTKGYPLTEALKMTGWDQSLKPTSEQLTLYLTQGDPIDVAFRKVHFSNTITNFLYFGRVHHDLPTMFKQCGEILRIQKEYSQKLKQTLRYPIILMIFLVLAFSVIKQTILPNFILLFQGEESNTLFLIHMVDYLINILGILAVSVILLVISYKYITPTLSLEKRLMIFQRIPLLRFYQSFVLSFLFTTHLRSLLSSGLTLKQSLEIISQHTDYEELAHYSHTIISHLEEGKTLAQAVHLCPLLRGELTSLFHQTNDLEAMSRELEMLADFFVEYINERLTKWMHMIQPIFFIFIAVIIVLIYASIMFPLYQWMDQI